MAKIISSISIHGFKSIQNLDDLKLNNLNILIGSNGAGKSNFISFLAMLQERLNSSIPDWFNKNGGANQVLTFGSKKTPRITAKVKVKTPTVRTYSLTLEHTNTDTVYCSQESVTSYRKRIQIERGKEDTIIDDISSIISGLQQYHFHDTSPESNIKLRGNSQDNAFLRTNGSNLAAFLAKLQKDNSSIYKKIIKTIQLVIPFFDNFHFFTYGPPENEQIQLGWKQKNIDYPFYAAQLSDGALRYIGIVTALLQPKAPSTLILDEPELGLHPYAINVLGGLLRAASKRMQIIISTQSVSLINNFNLEDLIIVERDNGVSTFKRIDSKLYQNWLEEYSVGDLWAKNLLGGRPPK